MKIYKKAILPKGFLANGVACGIKKIGKLDLALFYSEVPAKAGALFTCNAVKAAPIKINKKNLKISRSFKAVLVNSGNANAFTGKMGIKDAESISKELAHICKIEEKNILLASTGIIGKRLPQDKIKRSLAFLLKGLSRTGITKAKQAILTTDTFFKDLTVKFKMGKQIITLCAVGKGAGMIAPHLATMLVFIFTDAYISQSALNQALRQAVALSFNCITVDGCMSTNDTVIILANGQAKNPLIQKNQPAYKKFTQALIKLCQELAKLIVKDGEGATKFISIKVEQARDFYEARRVGLSVANSNLFKSAVYGENPNWGRIVAAVGSVQMDNFEEEKLKIKASTLKSKNIDITIQLGRGKAAAQVYTTDITPKYIKINASYN